MAQATHTLSRRSIFAAAAAVIPAVALTTIPLLANPDAAIFSLVEQIDATIEEHNVAAEAHEKADELMAGWHKRHPKPKIRRTFVSLGDDPNADLKDGMRQHEKKLGEWAAFRRKAEDTVGLGKKCAASKELGRKITGLVDTLTNTPANTLAGIVAKASIADADDDSDLAFSIISDLLAMQGA